MLAVGFFLLVVCIFDVFLLAIFYTLKKEAHVPHGHKRELGRLGHILGASWVRLGHLEHVLGVS